MRICPDNYSATDTQKRLKEALRGAFSGPPTPLKAIPKRNGESRAALAAKPMKDIPKRRPNKSIPRAKKPSGPPTNQR
jgi:hypothetical protein